jgi:hypothetical protein
MKQLKILLLIITLPIFLLGQTNSTKSTDRDLNKIISNIYRIYIVQPMFPHDNEPIIISGMYEHRFKNTFSFVGKLGIGGEVKKFGSSTNPYQTSFHLYSAIEGRYYFTINRRLKKEKAVQNLSCPYISLEQNIITNQIALINQVEKEALKGTTGLFLNLGYQKQLGKLYLGTFFGVRLGGKSFSKYDGSSLSSIHGGLMVGYVF